MLVHFQLCEEQQIPLNDVDGAYQKRYVSRYNDQLGIKQPSVTETLVCTLYYCKMHFPDCFDEIEIPENICFVQFIWSL